MIDFELNTGNLVRQESETVTVKGAPMKVEYRLHRDEFPNPTDPAGTPIVKFCLHVPQINQTYVDDTEEFVFEAFHEFFEEDFIRHFATRLVEEREKRQKT